MTRHENRRRAFTMRDLLAVIACAGFVALIICPALGSGSSPDDDAVCLSNLRQLAAAVRIFIEEYGGRLPGPLYPGVSHDVAADDPNAPRQLVPVLRTVLGPEVDDRMVTCPVMENINPDVNFGTLDVIHYGLNNYGSAGHVRSTSPNWYFGSAPIEEPKMLGTIGRPAEEWMVADAWYRPRGGIGELTQEGPYQSPESGEHLPNFAPHGRRVQTGYKFVSSQQRGIESSLIRMARSDGLTNTAYFDGHAAPVPSRVYSASGFELLYGFSGTVNPAKQNPPPFHPLWDGFWR